MRQDRHAAHERPQHVGNLANASGANAKDPRPHRRTGVVGRGGIDCLGEDDRWAVAQMPYKLREHIVFLGVVATLCIVPGFVFAISAEQVEGRAARH